MFTRNRFEALDPWYEALRKAERPVFIYGMGDGCIKVLREFDKYGIQCRGIFASDGLQEKMSLQGLRSAGFRILSLSTEIFVLLPLSELIYRRS